MARQEKRIKIDSKRIREIISNNGKDIESVAGEMGISDSCLHNYFRIGEMVISKAKLLAIILGCEVDDLMPSTRSVDTDVQALGDLVKKVEALQEANDRNLKIIIDALKSIYPQTANTFKKVEHIADKLEEIDTRTVNISNRTIKADKNTEALAADIDYIKKRLPAEETKVEIEPLEFAKAFIEQVLKEYEQVDENTIIAYATKQGIERQTLNLAKDDLGCRVITTWMNGKKVKVWTRPYGEAK